MTKPTIAIQPTIGALRVIVDGECHEKPATGRQMRALAIALLKVAERTDEIDIARTADAEIGMLREKLADLYVRLSGKKAHSSDCATSRAPAYEPGPCDCDAR